MERFLRTAKKWLGKVRNTPVLGTMAEDLMTLLELLEDYLAGRYPQLPKGIFLSLLFGLGYALCPIDLILDVIPLAGYLDDAAILMLLLDFFAARDIQRYQIWKRGLQEKGLAALRENCLQEILARIGKKRLAAPYLTEHKQLRLLLCEKTEQKKPLLCSEMLLEIPLERLSALGVESWEELGRFYTQVFQDPRLNWSCLGPRPFMPEYDEQAKTDDFTVK